MSESPPLYKTTPNPTTPDIPPSTLSPKDTLQLQMTLDMASDRLLFCPPSLRAGWLVYLLQKMDAFDKHLYSSSLLPVLQALHQAIATRLETGSW